MLASLISLTIDFLTSSYLLVVLLLISLPTIYFLFFIPSPPHAPPTFHFLTPALSRQVSTSSAAALSTSSLPATLKHGDCFRLRLLHKHMTVMIGPEANQFVFEAKDSILSQQEVYSFTVPVFGKNIVYDAPRPVMQQQLKFTAKGLNKEHMERHAEKIVMEAEEFFAKWGQEGEVDLLEEFSRLIILTASRCLLGEEIRNTVHAEFAELYQTLSDGMSHISFFWPYAPTKAHAKRDEARNKIRAIFAPVIAKRRAESEAEREKHDDFLQVLVDSKYTDGTAAKDEEIGGMLLAALFGGQHTSNITSTWLGFHLIQQKDTLMRRLLDEQKEVLGGDDRPTFTSLSQMELLAASMKETLRMSPHKHTDPFTPFPRSTSRSCPSSHSSLSLSCPVSFLLPFTRYPPLIALMRTALEPIQYKGYTIPKGDIVTVVPPVSHALPHIFSNPTVFDPDRFFLRHEDNAKYAFISFGGGRHGCLGQQFAFLQVKSIWSTLMRGFDFELIGDLPVVDYSNIVAGPTPPCRVRFKRKKDPYSLSHF